MIGNPNIREIKEYDDDGMDLVPHNDPNSSPFATVAFNGILYAARPGATKLFNGESVEEIVEGAK